MRCKHQALRSRAQLRTAAGQSGLLSTRQWFGHLLSGMLLAISKPSTVHIHVQRWAFLNFYANCERNRENNQYLTTNFISFTNTPCLLPTQLFYQSFQQVLPLKMSQICFSGPLPSHWFFYVFAAGNAKTLEVSRTSALKGWQISLWRCLGSWVCNWVSFLNQITRLPWETHSSLAQKLCLATFSFWSISGSLSPLQAHPRKPGSL